MGNQSLGLIDTHAHIQSEEFASDINEALERARGAGVEKIIVVGGAGDLSSNDAGLELSRHRPGLFATVGMHPHDAREVREEDLSWLRGLTRDPKVVAVGETGLDFYYEHSPRQVQMELFCRFIHMACETELPLVVHDRDAHREVAEFIRREGKGKVRGVLHCFTGDFEDAKIFLDLGLYLSFTGIVTFKNAGGLREVVRKIPLDRVLVETDAPYLAPVPYRGRRNEPAFVQLVAETIAEVRGLTADEVARTTSLNAQALFGI
ncbi:MAG: TatD family hydrolase [Candidatus Binatia bacterium]